MLGKGVCFVFCRHGVQNCRLLLHVLPLATYNIGVMLLCEVALGDMHEEGNFRESNLERFKKNPACYSSTCWILTL